MRKRIEIIVFVVLLAALAVVAFLRRAEPSVAPSFFPAAEKYAPIAVESSQLHHWKLEEAQKTVYSGPHRNIFNAAPPPPPVKPAPSQQDASTVAAPSPPPPPVLPMKFFGYAASPPGGPRRAFFTDGEDVYIVGEGETLLGRYRVLHIGNNSLEFEELSSGRRGTSVLEEGSPSA